MYTLILITLIALPGRQVERLVPTESYGPMSLQSCQLNVRLMGEQKQPDSRVMVVGLCLLAV